jgi:hypothetical protein
MQLMQHFKRWDIRRQFDKREIVQVIIVLGKNENLKI